MTDLDFKYTISLFYHSLPKFAIYKFKKKEKWGIYKIFNIHCFSFLAAMSSSRSDDVTECVCLKSFFMIEHSKHMKQYV